ncbi:MAG: tetratricopeptide repeat protein [Bacteroidota bacterium]
MKAFLFTFLIFTYFISLSQDYYNLAKKSFNEGDLEVARHHINKQLRQKPTSEDYFLSGMIHEAEGKNLRALADYEAVVKKEPYNLEAFFQKGVIYYNSASCREAIKDFTYVIDHHQNASTHAIYFANDPLGAKGTFITSLQSMVGRVYQYRGLAYYKIGNLDAALQDFNTSFEFDTLPEYYINRSQLYVKLNESSLAKNDLRAAIKLEPENYLAWYNLVLIDESVTLPPSLMKLEAFSPMLNLIGANAYEQGKYGLSASYFTKAIENNPKDELAILNRGKALLKTGAFKQARADFFDALQLNKQNIEVLYLVGNAFFYEKNFKEAIAFYEQYLSVDRGYANVWYNAAIAYLSFGETDPVCSYLKNASLLGMSKADEMISKQCRTQ